VVSREDLGSAREKEEEEAKSKWKSENGKAEMTALVKRG
jgi:hypothetical protein